MSMARLGNRFPHWRRSSSIAVIGMFAMFLACCGGDKPQADAGAGAVDVATEIDVGGDDSDAALPIADFKRFYRGLRIGK